MRSVHDIIMQGIEDRQQKLNLFLEKEIVKRFFNASLAYIEIDFETMADASLQKAWEQCCDNIFGLDEYELFDMKEKLNMTVQGTTYLRLQKRGEEKVPFSVHGGVVHYPK